MNGWAFAGDVAHLMGFKQFLEPNIAVHWLDVIFASFGANSPASFALTPSAASTIICGRVSRLGD